MNPVASEFDTGGTIEPHRPAIDLHDRPTRAGQACARSRTIVGKAAAAACGAASSRDAHRIGIAPVAHAVAARGSRSEEHTSELQSLMRISYAVFCLKKKMCSVRKIGNTHV